MANTCGRLETNPVSTHSQVGRSCAARVREHIPGLGFAEPDASTSKNTGETLTIRNKKMPNTKKTCCTQSTSIEMVCNSLESHNIDK